jgi:hypothetical protein
VPTWRSRCRAPGEARGAGGSATWCETISAVDWALVAAGLLLMVSPFNYRRQMRAIHGRVEERGGDVERFERRLERGWIPAFVWGFLPLGAVVVVLGLTGS